MGKEESPQHSSRDTAKTPRVSLLAQLLLLLSASGAVLLAGGPQQGALGVFLVGAGFSLIVCPPQRTLPRSIGLMATITLALAALALLPNDWITLPQWRTRFDEVVGLRPHISVVPDQTLFWLSVLGCSLAVGVSSLAHPLRSRALLAFATVAASFTAAYAGLAIYAENTSWKYPFDQVDTFGFFLNKNHTANLLLVGALLAMAVLSAVWRGRYWIAGIAATATLITNAAALIFFSNSRAGILFLMAGVVLWLLGLGSRHRHERLLIVLASLSVAVAALFLLSNGEARDRLLALMGWRSPPTAQATSPEIDLSLDFRVLIFQDAFQVIRDFPITGCGLGTFPLIFSQYRDHSLTSAAVVHPESDWLMALGELGLPWSLAFLGLIGVVVGRLDWNRQHAYWPLRWGMLAAGLAAILHGLVDVPFHRVALGWWLLVAVAPALRLRPVRVPPRWQLASYWLILAIVGVGSMGLGLRLIQAEWFGGKALPPFRAEVASRQILTLFEKDQWEEALELANAAVIESPMDPGLRYQQGVLLMRFEGTDEQADRAFAAERALNPDWPQIPYLQGLAWRSIDPSRTAQLWREAFDRNQRIGERSDPQAPGAGDYLSRLMRESRGSDIIQSSLLEAIRGDANLLLAGLESADTDLLPRILAEAAANPQFVQSLTREQRTRFLWFWHRRGPTAQLTAFMQAHPSWTEALWPVELAREVAAKDFQNAVRKVWEHYHLPLDLATIAAGASRSPSEHVRHYFEYLAAGNTVAATRILLEAISSTEALPEDYLLAAAVRCSVQDWEGTWPLLEKYFEKRKIPLFPPL